MQAHFSCCNLFIGILELAICFFQFGSDVFAPFLSSLSRGLNRNLCRMKKETIRLMMWKTAEEA
jgi:hypothetical protein